MHSFKTIYNLNGLKGFWSGTLPTVIRQGSSQGISFPVFQKAKPIFDQYTYLLPISSLLGGVCGGVTAVFINNPIDSMKTYKQSDRKDKSLVDIAKEIKNKRHEGILYRHEFETFKNGASSWKYILFL